MDLEFCTMHWLDGTASGSASVRNGIARGTGTLRKHRP